LVICAVSQTTFLYNFLEFNFDAYQFRNPNISRDIDMMLCV